YFELAHGGTIFLDEIDKIPLSVQSRLLRVLQEKEIMRVGGDRVVPVDVRIIAATNQDLKYSVLKQGFRQDLYFRLNVLPLKLPPLRERDNDIELLARHFINKLNQGRANKINDIPEELITRMKNYNWPGNVRELENFVERFVTLYGTSIDSKSTLLEQLSFNFDNEQLAGVEMGEQLIIKIGTIKEMEQQIITKLDAKLGYNKTKLAKMLGISRTTLWKRMND
ncbi:MAG: sigma 54-interacting transcriptional regulator, partial [Bacillota bacterium]